jgi:large subunit ribosomal protein L25
VFRQDAADRRRRMFRSLAEVVMSEALKVEIRSQRGKRRNKRLRAAGAIPAVLYGEGRDTLSLAIPADQVSAALRHGARLVDLQGAVTEKAFIRDLQWDTYGLNVLHMDLSRVSESTMLRIKVSIELRGSAIGVKEGGVIDLHLHELDIECKATQIPDKIQVNINDLHLGKSITVGELHLPEGVKALTDAETVVVACVLPRVEEEVAAGEAGAAEPELIGRKAEAEGEEGAAE